MPGYSSIGLNGASDSYLLLEDGSIFLGKHFGANVSVDGEIGKFIPNTRVPFFTSRSKYTCTRARCFLSKPTCCVLRKVLRTIVMI